MIPTSTKPLPWPVPWAKEQGQRLFFRPGDVIERADFEGELAGEHGVARVFPWHFQEAFARGVEALLADSPDDAAQMVEWARAEDEGEELAPEDRAALAQTRDLLNKHWPEYKALTKRQLRRTSILPVAAFRRFCTGWEGEGLPEFRRDMEGLVAMDVMAKLDQNLIMIGGYHAYGLLYGGGKETEKNSAQVEPSDSDLTTSSSDTSQKGGSSETTRGRKTPSSRSRRGSSQS